MKALRIFAITIAALMLFACQKKKAPQAPRPPSPVVVQDSITLDAPRFIECMGTMHSLQSVAITPQVGGQLVEVNFTQGAYVKEGDVIARIDPRPYEAAVERARGALKQAQAQLEIDQLEVNRNRKLVKDNYVDKQTFDAYLAKVEVDKGVIESCRGDLKTAEINLQWCEIKAPISGRIGLREADLGNVVAANSSRITTIEQLDKLYVDFVIPNQYLFEVRSFMEKNGGKLDIDVKYIEENMRGKSRRATVSIIQNQIRYKSGTVILRGEIDNKDSLFWPNQPVKVNLILETIKNAVSINYAALETAPDGGKYIYTADVREWPVREVKRVGVEVIQINDDGTCLVKGLKGGTSVVVTGQLAVSMGSYALAYSSTLMGLPYGKDGKPINPKDLKEFLANATVIAQKLRAEATAAAVSASAVQQGK